MAKHKLVLSIKYDLNRSKKKTVCLVFCNTNVDNIDISIGTAVSAVSNNLKVYVCIFTLYLLLSYVQVWRKYNSEHPFLMLVAPTHGRCDKNSWGTTWFNEQIKYQWTHLQAIFYQHCQYYVRVKSYLNVDVYDATLTIACFYKRITILTVNLWDLLLNSSINTRKKKEKKKQ